MKIDDKKPIEDRIAEFEGNPSNTVAIRAYRHWMGLTDFERSQIWSEWKQYYDDCAVSEAAAIFWEMRDALKKNDKARMRDLAAKAREVRENNQLLPQPKTIDPYWYMSNQAVFAYRSLMNEKARKKNEISVSAIFS